MAEIIISLEYNGGGSRLRFPINPSQLKKEINSESSTVDVIGTGEVSMPRTPSLAKVKISSFFWAKTGVETVADVDNEANVKWLEDWQASRRPATLVVEGIEHFTMYVTCDSFWHEKRAGEENTVYFELQLKEYREYGTKVLKRLNTFVDDFVLSAGTPTPFRIDNKQTKENPYTTSDNDSIVSLSRQSGMTPATLYKKNMEVLSQSLGEISHGDKLTLVQ